MIRKPELPLQQVINRYKEKTCQTSYFENVTVQDHLPKKKFCGGPLPASLCSENVLHFKEVHHSNGFLLSIHNGNNCIKVDNFFYHKEYCSERSV